MKNLQALIQVFCKSPIPGEVKTRLAPMLGNNGALNLHEDMTSRTLKELSASSWEIDIWATPDKDHEFFSLFHANRYQQLGSDLGARMASALNQGLSRSSTVILVGTDVPAIDCDYIEHALIALDCHNVVLGPTEDGGYGLVGVRDEVPDIFSDVDWGSDRVLGQTCARLNELRVNYGLLPLIWDVDRPEDIPRYYDWLNQT